MMAAFVSNFIDGALLGGALLIVLCILIEVASAIRYEWSMLSIGTKSVLIGAHCFFLHPWFVAMGWWKLNGFPWDPRLWFAFVLHDIGYIGKINMDGPEGESHPEVGARIMGWLFDRKCSACADGSQHAAPCRKTTYWHDLCLRHSRYYCKKLSTPPWPRPMRTGTKADLNPWLVKPSKLCFADKLVPCFEPAWLYLPRVTLTGEIEEFLDNAQKAESIHWRAVGRDKKLWYAQLQKYMLEWVDEHKDGAEDTWTNADRNKRAA